MKRFLCLVCLFACSFGYFSCTSEGFITLSPRTGYLDVKGGKIWYRILGEGDKTPLLMLHGGPGFTSYYLTALADSIAKDRPVIIFDQLGCGRSDKITDTSLMDMQHHVDQVSALLKHLNIKEYDLYGHSFGTMLAMDFYLQHPENIRSIILASPCMRTQTWVEDADILMQVLPDSTRHTLQALVKGLKPDSVKLADALTVYYGRFYNRKKPLSPYVDSSLRYQALNVYKHMWGPEEFVATGNLKAYDRTADLAKLKIPVLFTAGEYDAARPATVMYYQSLVPVSSFVEIMDAGHSTMTDNIDSEIRAIRQFWRSVNTNKQ